MKYPRIGFLSLTIVLALLSATRLGASPGKILVMNDEWTLSDYGYSQCTYADVFAKNIATWVTGGASGNFLAYSSNFGLTGSNLASTMTGAGESWSVNMGISFTLPTLMGYDAVFLAGNPADNHVLIDYVNAGGNVVLEGGTGWGGAAAEAAQWNTFLNAFGLGFGSPYNGVGGNIQITNSHPLFQGVEYLFQDNGNPALDIDASDPASKVLVSGLYAVYEPATTVPDGGSSLALLGGALFALAAARRLFR